MTPWAFAAASVVLLAASAACLLVAARGARERARMRGELAEARDALRSLTERVAELRDRPPSRPEDRAAQPRGEVAPFLITGLVRGGDPASEVSPPSLTSALTGQAGAAARRQAGLVRALERSSPGWVPAKPLRAALVKGVALGHGVRCALSADSRDRIAAQVRIEVRRSRRRRKAEVRAVRKYLRDRRRAA